MSVDIIAGETVQLKSGGPRMTVSEVKTWNGVFTAWCDWFEGNKKMSASFPVTSLRCRGDAPGASGQGNGLVIEHGMKF
jgi:uncharacterized protein YodC (DUF2158 family)